ncbi:MAG: PP2C family protein-serine/threonine phosphatase, partial [Spirochaetota bacterium]
KQQDADYFLTSILLTPLTSNQNKSETVQTNFYSKQKKSFIFHNRQYEIGGDISITANAKFLGKDYTVFLNADAMGKSIQGAGGALVLGVVFNSILTRQVERVTVGESPRKWLKKVFVELQRVFESFGGSMYISCIIGLVENESGQVVFFNADHPRMVLLRQGKARFLESKIYLNKLGMPDNEDLYKTQSFYLSPGDVLFLGSDGKDDLCLREENGRRVINDDENLFLQSVERGKGDTEAIVADCLQQGTLTDDMTLVRIEFQGSIQHNWKTNCLQQTNGQKSPLVLNNKAVA